MRWLAGAGLFALVGCNQIFGLQATQAFDAPPDGVLDRPHVRLDWQVATTTAADDSPTSPITPVDPMFVPISPAPKVRIAPLFADATNTALGAFVDPKGGYTAADGTIAIPRDYITQPWRLEYTLADRVVHEVQWQPEAETGHITVPIFGRLDRALVPAGAGYTITPTGLPPPDPDQYHFPRLFTTGLWTEGSAPVPSTGPTIDYDFAQSTALSGAAGAPDPAKGDRAFLIDYAIDTGVGSSNTDCRKGIGSATFDATLEAPHQARTPAWDRSTVQLHANTVGVGRLASGIGILQDEFKDDLSILELGALPSTRMPGLSGRPTGTQTAFNLPVMVTLLQCRALVSSTPATALPDVISNLQRVVHVRLVDSRSVHGVSLLSGIETVIPVVSDSGADNVTITFPAPFPTNISLTPPGGAAIPVGGQANGIEGNVVPASTGVFTLTFTPEAGPGLSGDYYDVLLRRVDPSALLAPQRIYTVLAPPATSADKSLVVAIDGALLASGAEYTFEIHAYRGHPQASQGDLSVVSYPYGVAVLTTRTIKITAN